MKKWSELMEANRDVIIEKMVEAYEKAEGGMSGWHYNIEMDQNGDVWIDGLLSQGSQSMSPWKGETAVITSISTWQIECPSFEVEKSDQLIELKKEYDELFNENNDDFLYTSFYEWLADEHQEKLIEAENELTDILRKEEISAYWETAADDLDYIIKREKECEPTKTESVQI